MSFESKSDDQNLFVSVNNLKLSARLWISTFPVVMVCISILTILAHISEPTVVVFNLLLMLAMIYLAAVAWLNRTVLHVDSDKISVYQRPIPAPWPHSRTASTADLKQVVVRTVGSTAPSYELWALLEDGDSYELLNLGDVGDANDAKQIEREIETFLDIEDDATLNQFVERDPTVSSNPGF